MNECIKMEMQEAPYGGGTILPQNHYFRERSGGMCKYHKS